MVMDDAALIERAREGSEDAITELFGRYWPALDELRRERRAKPDVRPRPAENRSETEEIVAAVAELPVLRRLVTVLHYSLGYAGAGASPTDLDADFFFAVAVTTRFLPVRFAS